MKKKNFFQCVLNFLWYYGSEIFSYFIGICMMILVGSFTVWAVIMLFAECM